MAITKEAVIEKIEVVNNWCIQVATDTKIVEDSKEISRSRKRHVLVPCTSSKDADDKWTHTDTDISAEATEVQAVANAIWTDTVKANYKTFVESQGI
jgi:hypothetical protein